MRTTVTLEDDLAGILQERARREGEAFRTIVNRVIRAGLAVETEESVGSDAPKVIPHAFGLLPGFDPDKMNQLADDLEVDAYAQSLASYDDPS